MRAARPRWAWRAVFAAAGLLAAGALAATPDEEIHALIGGLAGSGCQFERNGSWHPAAEAQAHLQRKYEWLRKRKPVTTTEQFIAFAASRSSISGKPYHVRCKGQGVVESAHWFGERLQRLRTGG